jgi:hypothetical protein
VDELHQRVGAGLVEARGQDQQVVDPAALAALEPEVARRPRVGLYKPWVARYPDDMRDLVVSGYIEGGEALERRAAVVDLEVGEGRVVLIGLRPQHRAQTVRTFRLLFNALYLHRLAPVGLD